MGEGVIIPWELYASYEQSRWWLSGKHQSECLTIFISPVSVYVQEEGIEFVAKGLSLG